MIKKSWQQPLLRQAAVNGLSIFNPVSIGLATDATNFQV